MPNNLKISDKDFAAAFTANDRRQRIQVGKIACLLAMILSLTGTTLDYFLYHDQLRLFIILRSVSVVVAGLFFYVHTTAFGQKYYRFLGVPIALNPIFFLGWVIAVTPHPGSSPYYAGWMLIIMTTSLVIRYNARESVVVVGCVLFLYAIICVWKGSHTEIGRAHV